MTFLNKYSAVIQSLQDHSALHWLSLSIINFSLGFRLHTRDMVKFYYIPKIRLAFWEVENVAIFAYKRSLDG